jgi:hypothetical protein
MHKPAISVKPNISVHKVANPRNFFKDIEDNTKAKLAAIDADDAARKADISSHKEAFQSRIASQNAAAKTPMVAAYKARFNSASSGNGPVPTQWYKNRPIKTD